MTIAIMLDKETMGNGLKPAICSIGAVAFDPDDFKSVATFYSGVRLVSSILAGLEVSPDTAKWWSQQDKNAKDALIESQEVGLSLEQALKNFMDFIDEMRERSGNGEIELWGNGMISDNVWLFSACDAVGIDLQRHVKYTEHKCYRQEMARALKRYSFNPHWEIKKTGTLHDPIDDCENQIRALKALDYLDKKSQHFESIAVALDTVKKEYC